MEFDFVIVGAGAAGCVLANRLSQLPKAPSVCLIERGPSHSDSRWSVAMPGGSFYNLIYESQRDLWLRYHTEPEKELKRRRIDCLRGTGWGGSSAVNTVWSNISGQYGKNENFKTNHIDQSINKN